MNKKERLFISIILLLIAGFTTFDLMTDLKEGVAWWHAAVEGGVALVATIGVFFLLRGTFQLQKSLQQEKTLSEKLWKESFQWKENSKRYIEGLSQSIEQQLNEWSLTRSEKEVAFLLIKGLSLKEIAELRSTSEKTTRTQATSIYS
ncbi:MAG TPA: hypothetical protein DCL41_00005, partial [Bdellovibrionales bacterium]|nr:hypothetical protein [Bdellovibrionales bacterium]